MGKQKKPDGPHPQIPDELLIKLARSEKEQKMVIAKLRDNGITVRCRQTLTNKIRQMGYKDWLTFVEVQRDDIRSYYLDGVNKILLTQIKNAAENPNYKINTPLLIRMLERYGILKQGNGSYTENNITLDTMPTVVFAFEDDPPPPVQTIDAETLEIAAPDDGDPDDE